MDNAGVTSTSVATSWGPPTRPTRTGRSPFEDWVPVTAFGIAATK